MIKVIAKFIKQEAAGGIVLLAVALLALVLENTAVAPYYNQFLYAKLSVSIAHLGLSKPLIFWINDGLMVIFFLLVGLEIKREIYRGELDTLQKAALPVLGALGGMAIPALIYCVINWHNPLGLRGWAIPSATDIAFSLGILSLLRSRVPVSLKVFLTALAIIDDLGAIIIIATFYTATLSWVSLILAVACLIILILFNRLGIVRFAPYGLVGLVMWVCVLKSGVHATLVGVALAFTYPLQDKQNPNISPSEDIEQALLPWVSFLVLPLFAFANAGLSFAHMTVSTLLQPIPLGIFLGLFIGKQIGIFAFCWLAIKTKLAKMPHGANWTSLYAVAIICGIGFTMSLFIGGLAFADSQTMALVRLGVLAGSFLSGLVGAFILFMFCSKK